MILIVNIDDTLIIYPENNNLDSIDMYRDALPNKKEISRLNRLYKKGYTIVLITDKNWNRYKLTVKQLENFGILYSQLVMGFPQGFYIDANSYKSIEEFENA